MARVYIGVGSNIEPDENVAGALRLLSERAHIAGVSTFYRTKPEGRPEQPDFINGVIEIETDLSPAELREMLRGIEDELDRKRTDDAYAPRTVDLDILIYDDLAIETDGLRIPDPQISKRAFLAIPLAELAPDLVPPGSDIALSGLAMSFGEHDMQPLTEFTEMLRKEAGDGS